MKKIVVPFKDFKTKHKVFITTVNFFILFVGLITFHTYRIAHPENALIAGVVVFVPTFSLISLSMLLLIIKFQKYYVHSQKGG